MWTAFGRPLSNKTGRSFLSLFRQKTTKRDALSCHFSAKKQQNGTLFLVTFRQKNNKTGRSFLSLFRQKATKRDTLSCHFFVKKQQNGTLFLVTFRQTDNKKERPVLLLRSVAEMSKSENEKREPSQILKLDKNFLNC